MTELPKQYCFHGGSSSWYDSGRIISAGKCGVGVSSMRLAHKKVLLHDMKSIETLARVNVLCVDKTGTITENSMSVKDMIPTKEYDAEKMPELNGLLSDFVGAMSSDNSTMEALKDYFKKKTEQSASKVVPFTSVTKYSGVMFGEKSYVIGAPEFVLREDYDTYKPDISEYARKGYRVLVFGSYDTALDGGKLTGKVLPMAMSFWQIQSVKKHRRHLHTLQSRAWKSKLFPVIIR